MKKRTLLSVSLLAMTWGGFRLAPANADPSAPMGRSQVEAKQVEAKLDYVVGMRSFSPAAPLSQKRLMELVLDLSRWGEFPAKYKDGRGKAHGIPDCDAYITRSDARRFVRGLLGQDLHLWSLMGEQSMPRMEGDKLGWWYNSGNTMTIRPLVRLTHLEESGGQTISCRFGVKWTDQNIGDGPTLENVGSGSAILKRMGGDWIITSWHITRNKNWGYLGDE